MKIEKNGVRMTRAQALQAALAISAAYDAATEAWYGAQDQHKAGLLTDAELATVEAAWDAACEAQRFNCFPPNPVQRGGRR